MKFILKWIKWKPNKSINLSEVKKMHINYHFLMIGSNKLIKKLYKKNLKTNNYSLNFNNINLKVINSKKHYKNYPYNTIN